MPFESSVFCHHLVELVRVRGVVASTSPTLIDVPCIAAHPVSKETTKAATTSSGKFDVLRCLCALNNLAKSLPTSNTHNGDR